VIDSDTLAAVERWATYREEFLDEVLVELRQAFAVRAAYLATRRA
jgi:hypothetical protein